MSSKTFGNIPLPLHHKNSPLPFRSYGGGIDGFNKLRRKIPPTLEKTSDELMSAILLLDKPLR